MKFDKRSLLVLSILCIFQYSDLFSQAAVIKGWRHSDYVYCSLEGGDTLIGDSPSGKDFYFDGELYTSSTVLVRVSPGVAIFYPGRTSVGTHSIIYGAIGSHDVKITVTVTSMPTVTLSAFPNTCSNAPPYSLFNADSSNVSPKNGTFTGTGVNASGIFNPAVAGPGTHSITYTVGIGSCTSSVSQTITVIAAPVTGINPFTPVCVGSATVQLTQGFPAGGTYSGTGVTPGGIFNQGITGVGSFPITYTYSNGTCSNSATRNIVVAASPVAGFSGLGSQYCTDNPAISLTGNPGGATGQFIGNGIIDNGNGTGTFDPSVSGLGLHTVSYIYTSAEGCSDTARQNVQVGTNVIISGLGANYCINATDVIISGNPAAGTFQPMAGLTDNLDGTAIFRPSIAGTGIHNITYTYVDLNGCINTRTQQTRIYALPVPVIQNLDASYCANQTPVIIRGNFAPSGTFTGAATVDNLNGTAGFSPSSLAPGGPYNITYHYTDAISGCQASVTNQVIINEIPTARLTGDASVCTGTAATLSIALTGSGPFNLSLTDGSGTYNENNINGPVYTKPVYPVDTAVYHVTGITDSKGCKNSGTGSALIQVLPDVAVLLNPVSQQVCPGSNVLFRISAQGINLNYQWQKDGVPIAGSNSPFLAINNVQPVDIGFYHCIVTGDCGNPVTSNDASLQLWSPVVLVKEPSDIYECEGENGSIQVLATGSNISYQWLRNNQPLRDTLNVTGSQSGSLFFSPLSPLDEGNYYAEVSGSCGQITSNNVTVTVDRSIIINTHPADVSICENYNAAFSVNVTGENLSYQWQLNGTDIPGETSAVLSVANITSADEGFYRCIISSNCGSELTSNAASLNVVNIPVILNNPSDLLRCEGDNAVLKVTATGTSITYKWSRNNVILTDGPRISGSNTSTLTISNLSGSDNGIYSCLISNGCDSVKSAPAELFVDTALLVTLQPLSQNACRNDNVFFSAQATGNHLNYQWYKNNMPLAGETNPVLVINMAGDSDSGRYTCTITNLCGKSVTTDPAWLHLDEPVQILQSPADIEACLSNNALFVVAATGTGLKYQWEFNSVPVTDGGNLTGTRTNTLIIDAIEKANAGIYNCFIQGTCGSERTAPASLVVNDTLIITQQPVNTIVCEGHDAQFITASDGALYFQWQKDETDIPGATSPLLILDNISLSDSGVYRCIIRNMCDTLASDGALLSVKSFPLIQLQPDAVTVCEGRQVQFPTTATGSDNQWQWMKDGADLTDGNGISGSLSQTLIINPAHSDHSGIYAARIQGFCGTVNTSPALLTVTKASEILIQPLSDTVCENQAVSFSVNVTGPVTYQWQKDNIDLPGQNSSTLHINAVNIADAGVYRCHLQGTCEDFYSDGASLVVNKNVIITGQPAGIPVCEGNNTVLTITAEGTNLSYQWKHDGVIVTDDASNSGSSSPALVMNRVDASHAGIYICEVSGVCGNVISNHTTIEVSQPVIIIAQPESVITCTGKNVLFEILAGGSDLQWQWQKDGTDIPGATGPAYSLSAVTPADSGIYRCVLTGTCGQVFSEAARLTVDMPPAIITQPVASEELCIGNMFMATVGVQGSHLIYQWYFNGSMLTDGGNVSGSERQTLEMNPVSLTDEGIYYCIVSNACAIEVSEGSQLWIKNGAVITQQPENTQACSGENITLAVSATGDNLSFQWQKNNVNVPGATNTALSINNISPADSGYYRCIVSAACGNTTSESVKVTVSEFPVITSNPPALVSQCEGTQLSLSVEAAGNIVSYQWKRNDADLINDTKISGSQSPTLIITGIIASDEGNYYCIINGVCDSVYSGVSSVDVKVGPSIVFHPADYSVLDGGFASFSVTAAGDITGYQWFFNGAPLFDDGNITGTHSPVLSIASAGTEHQGTYYAVVNGTCGNINSHAASLNLLTSSVIISQPTGGIKCEGETITLIVETTGTGHTYQWKKNGIALANDLRISGTDGSAVTITNLTSLDAGSYNCVIDGTENSIPAMLFVNRTTKITYFAGTDAVCSNEAISIISEASGDSLRFAWYKNGLPLSDNGSITGSAEKLLYIHPVDTTYTGSYTVEVTGACGTQVSDPRNVNVFTPVQLLTHPSDTAVCEGNSVNIQVTASGSGITWQWYKNGVLLTDNARINGSRNHTLLIKNTVSSDQGNYTCLVTGICDRQYSASARITVDKLITITRQPSTQTKCALDAATFVIETNISGSTYKWQKNGTDLADNASISGSSTPVMIIRDLQTSDNGVYRCVVSGSCNTVISNPATLAVNNETLITTQPSGGTICEGFAFNMSVVATGGALTYQWKKDNIMLTDGAPYSGTTTADLHIDNASTSQAGVYQCIITGICGTKMSSQAVLNVNKSTIITLQPQNKELCEGNDISLTTIASGSGNLYQWQKDLIPLADGGSISGSSTPVLHISHADAGASGVYRCVISGLCNNVSSQSANVQVLSAPTLSMDNGDTAVCEGNNLMLRAVATGSNISFTWMFNGSIIGDGGNISGSQTSDLYIQNILPSSSGVYKCIVSNGCAQPKSEQISVLVNQQGSVISQSSDLQKCPGDQATFRLSVSGNNVEYLWQFNGTPLADAADVVGSLTNVLTISELTEAREGAYRCEITDGCGNVFYSDPVTLTVNETLNITSVPSGDTLCTGESTALTVQATGSNLSWQWYRNGTSLTDIPGITGTQTGSLVLSSVNKSLSGYYSSEIKSSCGSYVTSSIPVMVNEPVQITVQPANRIHCEGETAVFSVTATGDSLSYQWFRNSLPLSNGARINGATSPLIMVSDVTAADAGSIYCRIQSACGSLNSQTASLTVNVFPAASGSITGEPVVCQGSTGNTYVINSIPNADYYRWSLPSGMIIVSGDSTRQIEVIFNMDEYGGPLWVAGVNGCGPGTSSPILNILAKPIPEAYAGENTSVCSTEGILNASDPGLPATGYWQAINGPAVIADQSMAVSPVSNLRMGVNRFVWATSLDGCTSTDTVTIYNNQLIVEAGEDTSICDHIYRLDATAPVSGTGQWSIMAGAGYNIERYNPKTLVSGLARGVNIFKWSVNNNGCVSYDTVKITNNNPDEAEAGSDQKIQADNTYLNANSPAIGTGQWSLINGSAVITDAFSFNTMVSSLGKGVNIFEWTINYKGCISRDTVLIENAITDSTDAGPNRVICSNSTRLSAKNPYPGYGEWSVRRGAATFADNSLYNTYVYNLAQGENVLIWTAYLNGITSDSVVIVNDVPTIANAGVNMTVCVDSTRLNANQPYIGTGMWSVINGSGNFDQVNSNITSATHLTRGINSFKWTISNGGCTSSSVVNVYNNRPTDAQAGFDAVTCEDSLVLNPNTPTFGSSEWSVYSGSAKFKGNTAFDLGRDDNLLVYSIRNAGCYSHDTIRITSHKPTTARLGTDQSICVDSVQLLANVPVVGNGTWALQSGSAQIDDLHASSTYARDIDQGENTFRWTVTYLECSSFDEMLISNDFVRADAGIDQVMCSDRTVLQANDPGYSAGNWTIIGGATGATIVDPHAPNSIVEKLAQGPNILRWTISKNSCVSYDEITLTNNNPTVAFAGENAYLCVNEAELRANPVTTGTGTWSILSGSGTFNDNHDPSATISNLGSGINVLRWTSENAGCISTDEVIISNNLPLNVFAGLDQVLCDDSTVLYANPPVNGSGSWSVLQGSALFNEPVRYNTQVVQLGNGKNSLKWTVSTTGCSASDTVNIHNNMPSPAIAGSDFPVCNSEGSLNANTPLFGTGEWSLISGAGTIINPALPRTSINELALGNNILQWTITNSNCSSSDLLTIINNSPTIADAGESAEVCGETAILYANSPVVGYGYWAVMSGTGDFADSLNYNTTISGLNFGDNTLRWTTQNGSCKTIDEIVITNNLAYVYAGEDQVVYTDQAVLAGNNPGTGTGQWLVSAGAGEFNQPGAFSTPVLQLGVGLNTYEWTITNGSCTARDQVVIHFKIMPQAGFTVNQAEGCPGLTVDFINTTRYGTTYKWEMGDGTMSTDVNPRHTYHFADNYTVRLIAYGPDNQLVITDTVIIIHNKPAAVFQFAPDTAFIKKPVRFYDGSFGGGLTYNWDFGDFESSSEQNPMHYYGNPGNYTITLLVTSEAGCMDTTMQTITVVEDGLLVFPNAFTPDINGASGGAYSENDFDNDVFHPYHENVSEFHMEIYSRWGVLLFETDDISIGWDGYYKGVLLERDVYVWKATGRYASGTEFLKTGNVLLLK